MSVKDEHRIFVGGLSWETTDDKLEQVFRRFGKVIEAQAPWLDILRSNCKKAASIGSAFKDR